MLAYRPAVSRSLQPVWYDRNGKRLGSVGEPLRYLQGRLSPDEKIFAAQIIDPQRGTTDLWLLDLKSSILSRFTSHEGSEDTPIWSPDGREVAFCSTAAGRFGIYRKVVGGGDEQIVLPHTERLYTADWLQDGSRVLLSVAGKSFYRLPPGPGAKLETLLKTDYEKDGPRVSPDGKWVAYSTNESGRWEVYIASFPEFSQRRQVSNAGGVQGYWRKDGKELFYLALDGTLMSVPVKLGAAPETGVPQVLFATKIPVAPTADQFAVTSDGRFLVLDLAETDAKPFTIVLNWPALAPK